MGFFDKIKEGLSGLGKAFLDLIKKSHVLFSLQQNPWILQYFTR